MNDEPKAAAAERLITKQLFGRPGAFCLFRPHQIGTGTHTRRLDRAGEFSEADARRLVACWNACADVSTEWLERNSGAIVMVGEPMAGRFKAVAAERDQLAARVGELTLALEERDREIQRLQRPYEQAQESTETLRNVAQAFEELAAEGSLVAHLEKQRDQLLAAAVRLIKMDPHDKAHSDGEGHFDAYQSREMLALLNDTEAAITAAGGAALLQDQAG